MTPKELVAHKAAPKVLDEIPTFKPMKRGKWPKPFHKMGSARTHATDFVAVSDTHAVVFLWRDGEALTDTSFYGYLMCAMANGAHSPVFEFHWHPSHKGFHCKVPCETTLDYRNRLLVGAPELALNTNPKLDPRSDSDRLVLIVEFCDACGISLSSKNNHQQPDIWNS